MITERVQLAPGHYPSRHNPRPIPRGFVPKTPLGRRFCVFNTLDKQENKTNQHMYQERVDYGIILYRGEEEEHPRQSRPKKTHVTTHVTPLNSTHRALIRARIQEKQHKKPAGACAYRTRRSTNIRRGRPTCSANYEGLRIGLSTQHLQSTSKVRIGTERGLRSDADKYNQSTNLSEARIAQRRN